MPTLSPGARLATTGADAWRLEIPAGAAGRYRLAQLDDYAHLPRRAFLHRPPLALSLSARASSPDLPGTWGFGLWNDPFSFSLGIGGGSRRLPALPSAAWFFFASPSNYLSLRDDLPASGGLAGVFVSPDLPSLLLAPGAAFLPLLAFRPLRRLLRRLLRRFIRQEAASLALPVQDWHTYEIEWLVDELTFQVDGQVALRTPLAPGSPLGLVIWIDNQFAAFPPDGRLSYGTLANPQPAWIEIRELALNGTPMTLQRLA